MGWDEIDLVKTGHIATLRLNRPEKLNAYTVKMEEEFKRAVDDIENDDAVKVLIVTGTGRGFCSGHDLDEMKEISARQKGELNVRFDSEGYPPAIFMNMSKPLIGAINGVTAGGGLALALACDIRISSEQAVFYETHVTRVGTVPGYEVMMLPRLVGIEKALEMMYTGRKVGAEEAKQMGLVSRVVPHDTLMETASELAAQIAKQPLWTLRLCRKAAYQGLGMPMEER